MTTQNPSVITYAAAGVDVEAGDRAVELMKTAVSATHNAHVVGGLGGFAGLFDVAFLKEYQQPLLATSTDGVGTKVAVAQALDKHDTIGFDLVGMVVDDIVVSGAKPLFMTDYIACGRVVPERIASIVEGIARACSYAGVALVGGETAEHPGLLEPDEYDVAGAATGVVDRNRVLGPHLVQPGDVLVGIESSGLHSNGYSLVRKILATAGWAYDRQVAELGSTIGEAILEPTKVYIPDILPLLELSGAPVHALSHVTGGGLAANLARVLPTGLLATVQRNSWQPPALFQVLAELGNVPQADLEQTLNMGVGMVAIVAPEGVSTVVESLQGRGTHAWVLGEVALFNEDTTSQDAPVISGAKGVDGGSVQVVGKH